MPGLTAQMDDLERLAAPSSYADAVHRLLHVARNRVRIPVLRAIADCAIELMQGYILAAPSEHPRWSGYTAD